MTSFKNIQLWWLIPLSVVLFFLLLIAQINYPTAVILAIVLLTVLFFRPKGIDDVLIFPILLSVYSFRHAVMYAEIFPRQAQWTTEIFLGLLLLYLIFYELPKNKVKFPYFSFVIGFIILFILNSVLWQNSNLVILNGIRVFLKFVPLFYLFYIYGLQKKEEKLEQLFFFLFALCFLQIPFAIYQYGEYAWTDSGDNIVGLMPNNGSGIVTLYLFLFIGFAATLYKRKIISKSLFIVISVLLLIPTLINETKVIVVLAPLTAVYYLMIGSKGIKIKDIIVWIAVGGVALYVFDYLYMVFWSDQGVSILSRDFVVNYLFGDFTTSYQGIVVKQTSSRGAMMLLTFSLMASDYLRFFFGYGFGSTSDSVFNGGAGPLFVQYGDYVDEFNMLPTVLLDIGFVGFIVLVVALVKFIRGVTLFQENTAQLSTVENVFLPFLKFSIFMFLLMSLYFRSILFDQFAVIFWALTGYFKGRMTAVNEVQALV